jgi:hypothetical protein
MLHPASKQEALDRRSNRGDSLLWNGVPESEVAVLDGDFMHLVVVLNLGQTVLEGSERSVFHNSFRRIFLGGNDVSQLR